MTHRYFDLSGKTAIVTGASRGIGFAIAQGLAESGARVILCGRDAATLAEAACRVGRDTVARVADVSREQAVRALAERMADEFGGLDILVNNAGIDNHYALMESTTAAQWQAILDTNLSGVFYGCRHLGALMLARGGAIVNTSSIAGLVGLKRQVPYCASKGGVEQLTKALALDWANRRVRVNAIAYGFVETALTAGVRQHPHIGPRLLQRIPMGRYGELDEVVGAAIFLSSPGASYVTGHTLCVDGGWTAA
ncbi:MAG TPA: SDR family NAD(P)-dependent oxidoreductase [Ottowia sp.]|uniref:SDR family NAD(P)-dependent oxidoreductase n=1 Tax=Ottowia sp. TaxID=1898956 RepID=UPI002B60299E|nr:SDR family NAD(P)-dependent oxidoreductase [Ottowia sp.]HMN21723.1 SDR family NAD(P)-dependent oxidoreductase [Ottowia sp.]